MVGGEVARGASVRFGATRRDQEPCTNISNKTATTGLRSRSALGQTEPDRTGLRRAWVRTARHHLGTVGTPWIQRTLDLEFGHGDARGRGGNPPDNRVPVQAPKATSITEGALRSRLVPMSE